MVETVSVNGRDYRLPRRPTLTITIDGCQPAYLDDGMARGLMPRLMAMLEQGGAYHLWRGQMPSLTNPNNLSIVTGAPLVASGLRSHGGRHEQIVPIVVSHPLSSRYAAWHRQGVRNSDLHDLLLNGVD